MSETRPAAMLCEDTLLRELRDWVGIETPTTDARAVNRLVDRIEGDAVSSGLRVQRIAGGRNYGDHLLVETPWGEAEEPGILVLSHTDTVHPTGTLTGFPFRIEGDTAFGPGIYDMKGGALLAFAALRDCAAAGGRTPLPIRQLFVSDEEEGSLDSRPLIEAEARRAKFVLVTEPAREGGRIVTARKATARFELTIRGRPAHSGTRHQDGRSAIRELARQILELESITDYESGVTVNVGIVEAGTRANVVPAFARAEIDMRAPDSESCDKTVARILALRAHDPDVTVEVTGGLNRPAYKKTQDIEKLFSHAGRLASEIGFELRDLMTGGGSDGNFTAALGVATLDGLGVDGRGAHTLEEQIVISSLMPRGRLLLRLMQTLS